MIIPMIGFIGGDTLGLIIVAHPEDTVAQAARKLQRAADVRVAACEVFSVYHRGQKVDPCLTIAQAGWEALSRFDVVPGGGR